MFKFLWRFIGGATKDTIVFGMRRASPLLEKKIAINRAKRSQRIQQFLTSANEQEKKEFLIDMLRLESMLTHYTSVSERLLLFIDNNVIQDILNQNTNRKSMQRFHSFLAILSLAQDYYLIDVFACVSPAILFEAGGKSSEHSSADIENIITRIEDAIAEAGLATHMAGFSTARQLRSIFKRISLDEKRIRKALEETVKSCWKRDFSSLVGGTKIPFSLAEEECPNIRLRYFNPGVVKLLFMHLIEKRMFQENGDQQEARGLMYNLPRAFSIIKKKNAGIEGLGDIELLTHCDLTSQTINNSPEITMGVTFDDRLYETLMKRSVVINQGYVFEGGVDSTEDFSLSFVDSIRQSNKRTSKINQRMREYGAAMKAFREEVLKDFIR